MTKAFTGKTLWFIFLVEPMFCNGLLNLRIHRGAEAKSRKRDLREFLLLIKEQSVPDVTILWMHHEISG